MRAQSAIDFLMTYSFMFLVLTTTIIIVVYFISAPSSQIPSQCSSFSGPTCNLVYIYTNRSSLYSIVTVSVSNAQSVPINITGFSVAMNGYTYNGFCNPYYLLQGQGSTCAANASFVPPSAAAQGAYAITAQFCNSATSNVGPTTCNYQKVSYGGAFITSPSTRKVIVFSVAAARGPASVQLTPYASSPGIPSGFAVQQNGDWIANQTNGNVSYAFGTYGYSGNAMGVPIVKFPSSLSTLSSNAVACSAPYNSVLSVASTSVYLPSFTPVTFKVDTDDGMEVYYRYGSIGASWAPVFGSGTWRSQPANVYGPNTIQMAPGVYGFSAEWTNICSAGLQAFIASNMPT